MKINFIGNFSSSMTGEMADEAHLAKNLSEIDGIKVHRIPRDIWQAYARGLRKDEWNQYVSDIKADVNVVAKWDKFTAKHIGLLRKESQAPVFYWTWDYMGWPNPPNWHKEIAQMADLHLTNERGDFPKMILDNVKPYYFPMDVTDEFPLYHSIEKKHKIVFFGSYFNVGNRVKYLKTIKDDWPLTIFSPNYYYWEKEGFEAFPPVWGNKLNQTIAESEICLHFSVNHQIDGYWSNRVGKILLAGGFLLAEYTKGMESSIGPAADYFSSPEEMVSKMDYYLNHEERRVETCLLAHELAELKFTSKVRMKELVILIERYLNHGI